MALLNLQKSAGLVLTKRDLPNPPTTQVCLILDKSGSMQPLYEKTGTVQKVTDRTLAMSSCFDDDGTFQCWGFNTESFRLPDATPADYQGYVSQKIMKGEHARNWGGTVYSHVINDVIAFYYPSVAAAPAKRGLLSMFSSKPAPAAAAPQDSKAPVLAIFITDGENDANDLIRTKRLLESAKDKPIYWQFIGIGSADFSFLEEVADALPNAGFLAIDDIGQIDDEELFEGVISEELVGFLKRFA